MNYKKLVSLIVTGTLLLTLFGSRAYAVENVYEVQKGDCLWKIAERFLGDGERYVDIAAWNEELIQDPNLIYPGMTLRIAESAEAERQPDTEAELQSSGKTPAGPYEKGAIKGTTWENEWLDMRLELPEGFRFGELQDYNIFNDDDASTFEFIVDNPSYPGMSMIMAVMELDVSMDEITDDLLDLLEQMLTAFGMEGVEWKTETVKLGGLSFQHYFTEAEYMSTPVYPEYYMAQKGEVIVYLQLFYMDFDIGDGDVRSDMKALINGFR